MALWDITSILVLRACKNVITGNISLFKSSLNTDIVHFYQSEYAHQYLLKAGVTKTAQLSDFINKSFFDIDTNPKIRSHKSYIILKRIGIYQKIN